MTVGVVLNASFNVNSTIYTANMTLPSSAPTAAAPFLFNVTSAASATPNVTTALLTVAVGAADEVYVAVSPPLAMINTAAGVTTGGTDVVSALGIVVSEGTFDTTTNQFTAAG